MQPDSQELRERVLAAVDRNEGTLHEIATTFGVSRRWIIELLRRRHKTEQRHKQSEAAAPEQRITSADMERLRQALQDRPEATVEELRETCQLSVSLPTMWRLQRRIERDAEEDLQPPPPSDQPIHAAAATNASELARLLDEDPALRDLPGAYGLFPLQIAAEKQHAAAVQILLERGAPLDARRDSDSLSALEMAVRADSLECVALLLAAGADPNARDSRGMTAIFYASSLAVLHSLIDAGADTDVKSDTGLRPFQLCAIDIDSLEVLRFWLEYGVSVNEVPQQLGWPAIIAPCANTASEPFSEDDRIAIMSLLLEYGADINLQDQKGETAVYHAAIHYSKLTKCVRFLLERGADPNRASRVGETPLLRAAGRNNAEMMQLLLRHGADPNLVNISWFAPLDCCEVGSETYRILEPITQRPERPRPSVQEILNRLRANPEFRDVELRGCTAEEIAQVEAKFGVTLPEAYRQFLQILGHGAGNFMKSDHWSFQVDDLPSIFTNDLYAEYCDLPDDAFVFANRCGYYWLFFVADGQSDDPPIFGFSDEKTRTYQQAGNSVWDFVEDLVIYYEYYSYRRP